MSQDGDPAVPSAEDVLSPPTGALSDVRRIGEGGSAEVFAARWRNRNVAMKVAKPSAFEDERDKERFLEEARRLARVDHPGVVKVLDTGALSDGRPYLLMELLEGETLADRIARGELGLEESVALFVQLAEAVDALHDAGLIHRDLKPGNVILPTATNRPVLLDLGIAKEVDATASTLTQAGVIRGTPAIMAPERFFGTPASIESDVYELGVILYSMLVGRLPWDNPTNVEARLFPRLPDELQVDLPESVVDVLMAALSTRPERRPASAGTFAKALVDASKQQADEQRGGTQRVEREPMPRPDTPGPATLAAGRSLPPTSGTKRASLAWLAVAVVGLGGFAAAVIVSGAFAESRPESPIAMSASAFSMGDEQPDARVSPTSSLADGNTAASSSRAGVQPSTQLPPLPTPSWALPRRTRHRALVWCNQIVDVLCDPELTAVNPNAKKACAKEMAELGRIESGPRSGWAAANKQCRNRHGAVQSAASLEKSGRRDEVVAARDKSMAAAASAFPHPGPDATLDAWLQRLPSCQAYVALFCSAKVRARRGDFPCNAARNAALTMARNAAKHGPETIAGHERTCRVMLEKDRASLTTEMDLEDTLHPPASASSPTSQP